MPIDYITMAGIHAGLTNLSLKQEWLRDFMNSCDIVFCDGFGVKWGARLLGESLPERLALPDWFDRLLASMDVQGSGLFFLGA